MGPSSENPHSLTHAVDPQFKKTETSPLKPYGEEIRNVPDPEYQRDSKRNQDVMVIKKDETGGSVFLVTPGETRVGIHPDTKQNVVDAIEDALKKSPKHQNMVDKASGHDDESIAGIRRVLLEQAQKQVKIDPITGNPESNPGPDIDNALDAIIAYQEAMRNDNARNERAAAEAEKPEEVSPAQRLDTIAKEIANNEYRNATSTPEEAQRIKDEVGQLMATNPEISGKMRSFFIDRGIVQVIDPLPEI